MGSGQAKATKQVFKALVLLKFKLTLMAYKEFGCLSNVQLSENSVLGESYSIIEKANDNMQ